MKVFRILCCLLLLSSCIENSVNSNYDEKSTEESLTLQSLVTKSPEIMTRKDSLASISRVQSDVNNLMMGCISFVDSVYVLSLKKEDALFLGVNENIYDKYLDYVDRLNEMGGGL